MVWRLRKSTGAFGELKRLGGQEAEEGHKDWTGEAETWVRVAGRRRSCCVWGCEKSQKDRQQEGRSVECWGGWGLSDVEEERQIQKDGRMAMPCV